MARTYKTRPWWVRVCERPMVTCRPEHDHRYGVCDLPDDPSDQYGSFVTDCRWTYTLAVVYGRGGGCGCRMCTDYDGRRRQRRAERRAGRAQARAAVRAVRGGADPFDL